MESKNIEDMINVLEVLGENEYLEKKNKELKKKLIENNSIIKKMGKKLDKLIKLSEKIMEHNDIYSERYNVAKTYYEILRGEE